MTLGTLARQLVAMTHISLVVAVVLELPASVWPLPRP